MNPKQPVPTIDVHELKRLLDNDAHLCLIDVRELDEWEEVHIPNAIHIPKDELPHAITTRVPDRDQPIYLHCKAGVRSLNSAQQLMDVGYKHVYSVNGGIVEWANHHYPIIHK